MPKFRLRSLESKLHFHLTHPELSKYLKSQTLKFRVYISGLFHFFCTQAPKNPSILHQVIPYLWNQSQLHYLRVKLFVFPINIVTFATWPNSTLWLLAHHRVLQPLWLPSFLLTPSTKSPRASIFPPCIVWISSSSTHLTHMLWAHSLPLSPSQSPFSMSKPLSFPFLFCGQVGLVLFVNLFTWSAKIPLSLIAEFFITTTKLITFLVCP